MFEQRQKHLIVTPRKENHSPIDDQQVLRIAVLHDMALQLWPIHPLERRYFWHYNASS
jgi:hypothetical protein